MSQTILITGASSGIGAALALAYAAPGIDLALTGRNPNRLTETENACKQKGATVRSRTIDVQDTEFENVLLQWNNEKPFDLVIANAGISGGIGTKGGEPADQVQKIFAINVQGILNTVLPIIPEMKKRGQGQIALMSSLAGFRGMPQAPAYSGSKAAIRVYGEGLRGELAAFGIRVSVICPGFVKSRITDANDFPMPFLMDADRAAQIIKKNLARDKARIAFPFPVYLFVRIFHLLPVFLTDWLVRLAPRKKEYED